MAQIHTTHPMATKAGIALGVLAATFVALAAHTGPSTTAASDRETGTVKWVTAASDRETGTVKPSSDRENGTVKAVAASAKSAGDKKVEVIKG
ncbi:MULTISPECIES: hypothetical protein [unclassified Streptomyces]|uniref:hypothetical protein n=1 Tax=unclassified Streptomyces TaxID=2593676 RepID=UPI0016602D6B|nr:MULTISPECIES: hypothetical protein [unclassified Streptomyces]MBD0707971.1 hypothetical protein [Streptomyces sp. CBMA291]MBD0715935.1 hypothetical protein [Streptomyces sp. CBMA370]